MMMGVYDEVDSLKQATGTNFLRPVNNSQQPASAPPPAPRFSVSGANGVFNWTVTPPTQSINKTLYYELSYSAVSNFTSGVTTQPATTATSGNIHSPGTTAYFRIRASYDQKNWSSYAYA